MFVAMLRMSSMIKTVLPTCASKEADFASPGIWSQEVNHLNTGFQHCGGRFHFIYLRSWAVNRPTLCCLNGTSFVNWLSQHVHDAAECTWPDWHGNGSTQVHRCHAALQSICGCHRYAAHYIIPEMLCSFKCEAIGPPWPSVSILMAFSKSGSLPGANSTSTTGPMTCTTRPILPLIYIPLTLRVPRHLHRLRFPQSPS